MAESANIIINATKKCAPVVLKVRTGSCQLGSIRFDINLASLILAWDWFQTNPILTFVALTEMSALDWYVKSYCLNQRGQEWIKNAVCVQE